MARSFGLDKFKNKVNRRSSDSSLIEVKSASSDRRNSVSNPMIIISESREGGGYGSGEEEVGKSISISSSTNANRLRAQSLSLINSRSRSRSKSVTRTATSPNPLGHGNSSKKHVKELIKQETDHIVSKKLLHTLEELGLQAPIPLSTTNGSQGGTVSKTAKIYVANTNDCIYLAPASSASFTYEDVENGGNSANQNNMGANDLLDLENEYNHQEYEDDSAVFSDDEGDPIMSSQFNDNVRRHSNSFNNTPSADPNLENTPRRLQQKMESFNSPNYLCTKIDSEKPIPHTFAVIIELSKDTRAVRDLKIEFQSLTNILWPTGDPYNKSHMRERFRIGNLEWNTSLSNADYYISSSNSNDVKTKKISPDDLAKRTREYRLISIRQLVDGDEPYGYFGPNGSTPSFSQTNSHTSSSNQSTPSDVYKAGLYVFLLPILLPEHIPPTIMSINGSLEHSLSVSFSKTSDKINRKVRVFGNYHLPMVRTPPSFANSIADKPIYVNRVWNDSVHYIITFPKKYVALGAEHVVNVKLVPLVKDVIIKRIKFNVLERITYVSKNLSKEYDYDGDDPYFLKPLLSDNKVRERVIGLCELKTKSKSSSSSNNSEPYKEEVIKCPENNLLFICYEPDDDIDNFNLNDPLRRPTAKDASSTTIASPLDINIALPFLTTRTDKTMLTSSVEDTEFDRKPSISVDKSKKTSISTDRPLKKSSVPGDRRTSANEASKRSRSESHPKKASITEGYESPGLSPTSPIIGALETNMSHGLNSSDTANDSNNDIFTPDSSAYWDSDPNSSPSENTQLGFTSISKALYPDSNFRHIQIHHRLQVCFRISKPDPKDDFRMHHYEVVVDTPLILVSAKCNDESVQLPEYDDIVDLGRVEPEAPPPSGIAFRTPNFERNGVSIRALSDDNDEQLPSFEEAMSAPSSPITRTFSVPDDPLSRIPSISGISAPEFNPAYLPKEPAPSYEVSESSPSPRRRASDTGNNSPVVGPLNIDELVNFESGTTPNRRTSRLRSSLVSSFAPLPAHVVAERRNSGSSKETEGSKSSQSLSDAQDSGSVTSQNALSASLSSSSLSSNTRPQQSSSENVTTPPSSVAETSETEGAELTIPNEQADLDYTLGEISEGNGPAISDNDTDVDNSEFNEEEVSTSGRTTPKSRDTLFSTGDSKNNDTPVPITEGSSNVDIPEFIHQDQVIEGEKFKLVRIESEESTPKPVVPEASYAEKTDFQQFEDTSEQGKNQKFYREEDDDTDNEGGGEYDEENSIITQETNFSQRLPLLHYVSTETIPTRKQLGRTSTTNSVLSVTRETSDEEGPTFTNNNMSSISIATGRRPAPQDIRTYL